MESSNLSEIITNVTNYKYNWVVLFPFGALISGHFQYVLQMYLLCEYISVMVLNSLLTYVLCQHEGNMSK